ncbi:MAG: protein kinase [Anaerolineae bacterium]|nr:protein kinase [Anaerolineae bacterium]
MRNIAGKKIAQYRVDDVLGEGGMGLVYRAYDETLQIPVALKVMHAHLTSKPGFRSRFLQEAQFEASMRDNPSIITVHEADYQDGQLYMVMELIPDGSLADYLRVAAGQRSTIQLDETLHLLAQVAEALHYAHRKGIVHRDIKPSNILIRKLEEPERPGEPALRAVVADFGLAKLRAGGELHTQTGAFLGTLQYMSPEQCRAEKQLDGRSDIYSLGIVLYQMVTGRLPFSIDSPYEAGVKHSSEQPPDPRAVQPELPDLVRGVVLKAIAKDPAARFQSAREMARALRSTLNYLQDKAPTGAPTGTGIPAISIATTERPIHETTAPIPTPSNPLPGDHLRIARSGERPRAIQLSQATTSIGKSPDNDLVLDDPMISRYHARIDFNATTGYSIVDLGSTNGTYFEGTPLTPNVAQPWGPGQTIRIGHTRLSLQPPSQYSRSGVRGSRPGLVPVDVPATCVSASLDTTRLTVDPGSAVTLTINVRNDGAIVDHFKVSIEDIPLTWVTSVPELHLMAGSEQRVSLVISPPRVPESRAGQRPFVVRVTSTRDSMRSVKLRGTLIVNAYSDLHSDMHPQRVRPQQPANITLENRGNAEENVILTWRDQADAVIFTPPQTQVTVPSGERATTTLYARPQRRPWIGGETLLPFAIDIASSRGTAQTHSGTVINKARFPVWILAVLSMLCIVLSITGIAIYTQTIKGRASQEAAVATATWLDQDDDGDGLANWEELERGTKLKLPDSDGDTLSDGEEVYEFHTDPNDRDTDKDGLPDNTDPDPINPRTLTSTPAPMFTSTPTPTPALTHTPTTRPPPTTATIQLPTPIPTTQEPTFVYTQ